MAKDDLLSQLTDEQKEKLERLCKEKGVSKSDFLESVINSVGKHIYGGFIDDWF